MVKLENGNCAPVATELFSSCNRTVLKLREIAGETVYSHKLGNRMSKLGNRLPRQMYILAVKYPHPVGVSRAEPSPVSFRPRRGRRVVGTSDWNMRSSWNKLRRSLAKSALISVKSANLLPERPFVLPACAATPAATGSENHPLHFQAKKLASCRRKPRRTEFDLASTPLGPTGCSLLSIKSVLQLEQIARKMGPSTRYPSNPTPNSANQENLKFILSRPRIS
ncbi:hypothetical protein JCM19039_3522 [Geomicrobium sp. JCM 19039]|nr:hypothetical protein JCM19039_3522 [Geomicrobium sp. JCM 19039]